MTKDKNRSFQDIEYKDKAIKYDSENLLARTLNSNCYSNNPLFLKFIKENNFNLKSYSDFTPDSLLERNNLYKDICKNIWDFDLINQL